MVISKKGKTIGQGRPLICVPVMAKDEAGICEQIKKLAKEQVEVIEWRVDAFENAQSMNAIRSVLNNVKDDLGNSILLFTYRSKGQGGLGDHDASTIMDIHQVGAESDVVDIIDVEYFAAKNPEKEIAQLKKCDTIIITSHHDFDMTPDSRVIETILRQMKESGTDIVKLALMPNNAKDVLRLLEETEKFHTNYPDMPIVTMSMGGIGMISRISGEFFGSCMTFGAGEVASAPGQLPKDELKSILDELHSNM